MKKTNSLRTKTMYVLTFFCFLQSAQAGQIYSIEKYVFASGGTKSSGGNYSLQGTIGQPLNVVSNSTNYTVASGFWHENNDLIFKNNFE